MRRGWHSELSVAIAMVDLLLEGSIPAADEPCLQLQHGRGQSRRGLAHLHRLGGHVLAHRAGGGRQEIDWKKGAVRLAVNDGKNASIYSN